MNNLIKGLEKKNPLWLLESAADAIDRAAHVMAIETVAECVENEPILDLLHDLGVNHALNR